jgi:signal transduction histidine kinase
MRSAASRSAPSKRPSLAADVAPLVTDADRLRTVLVNVLANAAQAVRAARADAQAPAAGPGVECRSQAMIGGGVVLTVRDEGAGIDPSVLTRVFEPYFTTRRAGTGLGLAIARNIVEGLGGTIAVSAVAPHGTEIRIELPDCPPGGQHPAATG